jgi:hypothetical protein
MKYIVIFCIIIIIFFYYSSYGKILENFELKQIELVVSRYNENLEWIKLEPFNKYPIIVYNKGINEDFAKTDNIKKIEKVPNVGRETHTYLYHIIQNYHNLAEVTIFLPGSADLSNKFERAKRMVYKTGETNSTVMSCTPETNIMKTIDNFQINNYLSTHPQNTNLNKDSTIQLSKIRPYGKWYKATFKHGEQNLCVTWNAIFSISKKHILQKSKSYYENLLKNVSNHSNPEEGHFFERSWFAVFSPYENSDIHFTS